MTKYLVVKSKSNKNDFNFEKFYLFENTETMKQNIFTREQLYLFLNLLA